MPAKTYNLIFMGTPKFAVPSLRALHEAGHHIVAVYSQPPRPAGRGQKETPSPVQQYAESHGLNVYTPTSLKEASAQTQFASHKADAAIVAAYGLLLPKPILDACPLGCINVHPSLLPRWRGAAPIQRTIMAGDTETAIVIMQMNEGLDTGDMLTIKHFPIPPGTSAGTLHDQLAAEAGPLLLQTLENRPTPTPQSTEGVTYAKKITKEEALINWNQPAEKIYQHILGLSPFPGATYEFTSSRPSKIIKVFAAEFDNTPVSDKPGTVTNRDTQTHACNPGTLTPSLIQLPDKKRMPTEDAMRGIPGTQE